MTLLLIRGFRTDIVAILDAMQHYLRATQQARCDSQVSALTNVTLPLIRGFRNDILQNPLILDAIHIVTQSPMLQEYFGGIGNFTGDLAPIIRAYTVRPPKHLRLQCRRSANALEPW